jgi:Tfp pilus assembly protein PilF
MNSEAAMVNLGNLALVEKDFDAAERWYNRALTINPANRIAANGLNRIAVERMD